jgi:glutamyl-Q tRNA(Asp) synthetase
MNASGYIGRFAPSPTGQLHMGSLLAAVASWCDARHHGGEWRVRMEDLDPPREVKGASQDILATLEAFGLIWDGPVVWQSRRLTRYQDALSDLRRRSRVYPCSCTRRELAGHLVYPGHCRTGLPVGKEGRLVRFKMESGDVTWQDLILGQLSMDPLSLGDFPVLRADGFWAYQLAVVVDDMAQGITHVIRGADLLDSTPRQIQLWNALQLASNLDLASTAMPRFGHVPILENERGQKLSKQTRAKPVNAEKASEQILQVLSCLNQDTGDGELLARVREKAPVQVLKRAAELWRRIDVPSQSIESHG